MYIHIHICIYIYIYIIIYTSTYIYIYIYHACLDVRTARVYAYTHARIHVRTVCTHACMYNNCLHFSMCACHPCAGAMLIFSVSFQF